MWYSVIMLLETLTQAIKDSGKSRYRIAKDTGVDPVILWRIFHGERGCSLKTADLLCDYLNLELVSKDKKEGK